MLKSLFGWLLSWGNKTEPTPPILPTPPIDIPGPPGPPITTDSNGEIDLGHLEPVVPALKLSAKMAALVKPADEALDVSVMNDWDSFIPAGLVNWFKDDPKDARGIPIVGPYKKGSDAFFGKGMVPVKLIFQGIVGQKAKEGKTQEVQVLTPLVEALSEAAWCPRPAMQFNIDGKMDNRIIFYDLSDAGNADIDALIIAAGEENLRLVKQNVWHASQDPKGAKRDMDMAPIPSDATKEQIAEAFKSKYGWPLGQGFRFEDLLVPKAGLAGSSHAAGFYSGYIAGKPIAITTDWGHEPQYTNDWNGNIFAIDYQAGCRDLIPEPALRAYKYNADMWDAIATMQIDFSSDSFSEDWRFKEYDKNPLEVHNHASAVAVARKLAELDSESFNKTYGAFYCAEGQYACANFGPLSETLIKKSNFGPETPLGKLIAKYHEAPGYSGMPADLKRRNPEIGWMYLVEQGSANGGISQEQFDRLIKSNKHNEIPNGEGGHYRKYGVYLDYIDESVKGWQTYRPWNDEYLIAKPLTVATMLWATIRSYLPREAAAKAVAQEIGRAYMHAVKTNDVPVQTAVMGLTKGADPGSPQGQMALAMVGALGASGWMAAILNHPAVKMLALKQAGGSYINPENTADLKAVSDLYDKFVGVLVDETIKTQADMDTRLMKFDVEAAALEVEWDVPRPGHDGSAKYKRATLMKFVPPACWAWWAQQSLFGDKTCVRYVATAIRNDYRKGPAVS